jgi:hypothetical protein
MEHGPFLDDKNDDLPIESGDFPWYISICSI